jgi:zeaxanthin glucosyltransferase
MKHFVVLAHAATGHLNPMIALGRALQRKGHRITFVQVLDVRAPIEAAGLDFIPIGVSDYPLGEIPRLHRVQGALGGLAAFRFTLAKLQRQAAMHLRDIPPILRAERVDGLLVDQVLLAGGSIADALELPFVTACCTVLIHEDDAIPPFNTSWRYSRAPLARLRNRAAYALFHQLTAPVRRVVNEYRREHGLQELGRSEAFLSGLAQVSQQPQVTEYPRAKLPACFSFTGPFIDAQARPALSFPDERLTGEPLIYASLGTLQNRQTSIFRIIVDACRGLKAQLVISLGGAADSVELTDVPETTIAVDYAPQLELLARARLTLTHAGVNTVLESLAAGVPLVAVPITNDQPGMAARVQWAGLGEVLPFGKATAAGLRALIDRVLSEERYRQRAFEVQKAIEQARGLDLASDIVDKALSTALHVHTGAARSPQAAGG